MYLSGEEAFVLVGVCVCTFPLVMQLVEKFPRKSSGKFFDNSPCKTRGAASQGRGWLPNYFFIFIYLVLLNCHSAPMKIDWRPKERKTIQPKMFLS